MTYSALIGCFQTITLENGWGRLIEVTQLQVKGQTFRITATRDDFNTLEHHHGVSCPDCGLSGTEPYPNCGCPPNRKGYGVTHINAWHHNCEKIWERAYG